VFGVMSLCVLGSVWVGGGVWVIGCCEWWGFGAGVLGM
jgi:hypothetical protein